MVTRPWTAGKIDRLRSILLTIQAASWYYLSAKKPAVGWSTVLI